MVFVFRSNRSLLTQFLDPSALLLGMPVESSLSATPTDLIFYSDVWTSRKTKLHLV